MSDEMSRDDLGQRRLAVVREHMESENRHEFDVTMATFEHPRYEIIPTGEVFDGPEEVARYFRTTREAFPDQRNEKAALRLADNAVIAEFDLLGTHQGELRGIPPTGRSFRCRMCAIFEFPPDSDHIICERVYFDSATIAGQLLAEATPRQGPAEPADLRSLTIKACSVRPVCEPIGEDHEINQSSCAGRSRVVGRGGAGRRDLTRVR